MKTKIPYMWGVFFYIGFILVNIHYIRYLNFYITKSIPYLNLTVDYSFYSNISLIIRIITFISNIIIFKIRNKNPVISTFYIWTLLFILLSHEHDIFTFLSSLSISFISMLSLFYYKKIEINK